MDEVAPNLYVGTLADAGDTALLQEHGVDSVVSLTHGDPESGFPVPVSKCAMMDGPRNEQETFRTAVEEVLVGLDRGETTLVHCRRGASRSPSVAATAVALHNAISIEGAFERIEEQRAEFDAHPALVRQAVSVYRAFPK
ncbi:dual specificity protein phosphatase family protein [Halolamina sp. CBA1230]|uniref:dual specificity protein phosphatase family protein n=1 Tax=Halolamina sp. CBA1230 TaxID=1853690 RepID=UPI0009A18741|nr:dual specificity protein phosphatase [Halolamina sp. CBA1230]QKY19667.1 dual specificity protein phosphatase family protein [Halolamina sp. CBA1230]